MISRAFVEAVVDETHVKVRIPRINKVEGAVGATPVNELGIGVVCSPPGYSPRLRRGDTVLVAYEDDDNGSPVVLGLLFNPNSQTVGDAKLDSVEINVSTKLPKNTTIGDVKEENIEYLIGLKDNAQKQFDELSVTVKNNVSSITETNETIEKINDTIDDIIKKVNTNTTNISSLNSTVSKINKTNELGALVLHSDAYGTSKPTGDGKEGQLYLYIE